jgi:A/G-specific adenine glycosylase
MDLSISTAEDIAEARAFLLEKGRGCYRELPWREDVSPWAVLVSEIMLQQTQVPRVSAIYPQWIDRFPVPSALARRPVSDILAAWSGLGYNRRALSLHKTAKILAEEYGDTVPPSEEALLRLPGIGVYTARAVLAFAFNLPSVFLETNIRTVFIRHFYTAGESVGDKELERIGEALLDRINPRRWYTALMDYGAWLKVHESNFGKKASIYRPQPRFKGSERELRGAILKKLLEVSPRTFAELSSLVAADVGRVSACAEKLEKEGFVRILRENSVAADSGARLVKLADSK